MEHLKSLFIFKQVLETGSMSQVAKNLNVSPSAISQQIQQLEKHYGLALIKRTTRSLTATEAGQILWQGMQKISQQLSQTEQQLSSLQTEFCGKVKLSLPLGFLLSRAVQQFLQQLSVLHPNIQLELLVDDQIVDMQSSQIDIAIRAAEPAPNSMLVARYLSSWQLCICASPNYLAQNPIKATQDLLKQQWIFYNQEVFNTAFHSLNLGDFQVAKPLFCNSILHAKTLSQQGQGLTLQLLGEIEQDLQNGTLTLVLPQQVLPQYRLYAVTAGRSQSAKIQAVLALLKDAFLANPPQKLK